MLKSHYLVVFSILFYEVCLQKQPSSGVLTKGCSENIQQIYRRTPMPKCDLQSNFIEITLWYVCCPVNLLHIFRTPFPRSTSGGNTPGQLLLYFTINSSWTSKNLRINEQTSNDLFVTSNKWCDSSKSTYLLISCI